MNPMMDLPWIMKHLANWFLSAKHEQEQHQAHIRSNIRQMNSHSIQQRICFKISNGVSSQDKWTLQTNSALPTTTSIFGMYYVVQES